MVICIIDNCATDAVFQPSKMPYPILCYRHSKNVVKRTLVSDDLYCLYKGCRKRATTGTKKYPNVIFCQKHCCEMSTIKPITHTSRHVTYPCRHHVVCSNIATFGYKKSLVRLYCGQHIPQEEKDEFHDIELQSKANYELAKLEWVSVTNDRCQLCHRIATHGDIRTKIMSYCCYHGRLVGYVNIKRKCFAQDCLETGHYQGSDNKKYCVKHWFNAKAKEVLKIRELHEDRITWCMIHEDVEKTEDISPKHEVSEEKSCIPAIPTVPNTPVIQSTTYTVPPSICSINECKNKAFIWDRNGKRCRSHININEN